MQLTKWCNSNDQLSSKIYNNNNNKFPTRGSNLLVSNNGYHLNSNKCTRCLSISKDNIDSKFCLSNKSHKSLYSSTSKLLFSNSNILYNNIRHLYSTERDRFCNNSNFQVEQSNSSKPWEANSNKPLYKNNNNHHNKLLFSNKAWVANSNNSGRKFPRSHRCKSRS